MLFSRKSHQAHATARRPAQVLIILQTWLDAASVRRVFVLTLHHADHDGRCAEVGSHTGEEVESLEVSWSHQRFLGVAPCSMVEWSAPSLSQGHQHRRMKSVRSSGSANPLSLPRRHVGLHTLGLMIATWEVHPWPKSLKNLTLAVFDKRIEHECWGTFSVSFGAKCTLLTKE